VVFAARRAALVPGTGLLFAGTKFRVVFCGLPGLCPLQVFRPGTPFFRPGTFAPDPARFNHYSITSLFILNI